MDKLASYKQNERLYQETPPEFKSKLLAPDVSRWLSDLKKKKRKTLPAKIRDAGDKCLTSGLRRSTGVGNGNPLQYSCLENPVDRGAWQATVLASLESWTQLSD